MLHINGSKTSFDKILLSCIRENRNGKTVKAFIKKATLCNLSDTTGNTLLHFAADGNNRDIAEYLIGSGCKIDPLNCRGKTPLILCIERKNKQIAKILLNAGADLELHVGHNRSAMQVAIDGYETINDDIIQIIFKQIQKDCHYNNAWIVNRLLESGWPTICIVLLRNRKVTTAIIGADFYYVERWRKDEMQATIKAVEQEFCEDLKNGSRKATQRSSIVQEVYKFRTGLCICRRQKLTCNGNSIFSHVHVKKQWRIAFFNHSIATKTIYCTDWLNQTLKNWTLHSIALFEKLHSTNNCFFSNYVIGKILVDKYFFKKEIFLAFLALHEAFGTPIAECIRDQINSDNQLRNYFGFCKRLLSKKVYDSVTLFQLLTENIENLTSLTHDPKFVDAVTCFHCRLKSESYYFHMLLQKKVKLIFLLTTAADVICKIMHIHYGSFPNVFETILSYLTQQDILSLWDLRYPPQPHALKPGIMLQ